MINKNIYIYLLFIPILLLQLTIIPYITFANISPDFCLILLIYISLTKGQIKGTITGFFLGLTFDLITGGTLGASAFAKTLAGFIAGYFYNENKIDINTNSLLFGLIIFIAALIDTILFSFFNTTIDSDIPFITIFIFSGILPAIYTSVVALVIMIFFTKRVNYE